MVYQKRSLERVFQLNKIKPGWLPFFRENAELLHKLSNTLNTLPSSDVLPSRELIFRAFEETDVKDVRVLVLGQDPYPHDAACGLAFSVSDGQPVAQSLKNISNELIRSHGPGCAIRTGDLSPWSQKVFLLNTALTTLRGKPGAHAKLWKAFTKAVISYLSDHNEFFVFIAWGLHAHSFSVLISPRHTIIKTSHPSPLGFKKGSKKGDFIPFYESDCFRSADRILVEHGYEAIPWKLAC